MKDITIFCKPHYSVQYSGGESRRRCGVSVNYMLVTVEHEGEEHELYAEIAPEKLEDEHGNPAIVDGDFNPAVKDPEWISFPYLKSAILDLCRQTGIDPADLDFGFGDEMPTYMMPHTEADSTIS